MHIRHDVNPWFERWAPSTERWVFKALKALNPNSKQSSLTVSHHHSMEGGPVRNQSSSGVIIATVKAITRRIYPKSGRELSEEFSEGGNTAPCSDKLRKHQGQDRHSAQTLPDDVLLEIFDHHRQAAIEYGPWKWHTLAQVCRRWRFVVFSYPRRLELRILLTYNKPIRKLPKSWAALPIIICYPQASFDPFITPRDENHISNLLKNPARICELDLDITRPLLEKCASFLEEPFPALDHLRLRSQGTMDTIVLPSNFLNGSAPRLRVLHLKDIAIPMLPGLLSSSKNLVSLCVEDITRDGYFTAKDLAIGLSAATQLNSLVLRFHPLTITPSSSPIPGLPTRINLPSLTEFQYEGESTYLRDFASRINVPIIEQIDVSFSYESEYNTHELCEFFSLGEALRSSRSRTTHIRVSKDHITFSHHFFRFPSSPGLFRLRLPYRTRYPTPLVTQVCLGLESQDVLLKVTHLEIEGCPDLLRWTNGWDPTSWLTLLRALTGLQRFHIVGNLASNLVSALARVTGETICEILPALQELHFGPGTPSSTPASIKPFITERQRYGLPVSVHYKKLNWIGDRWSE